MFLKFCFGWGSARDDSQVEEQRNAVITTTETIGGSTDTVEKRIGEPEGAKASTRPTSVAGRTEAQFKDENRATQLALLKEVRLQRKLFTPVKSTPNLELLNALLTAFDHASLDQFPEQPYHEAPLAMHSPEYQAAALSFTKTNKTCFSITKITSIHNPFHMLHYCLMKKKYLQIYRDQCRTLLMFHGTEMANLRSICTWNLDRSKIRTHKFGKGVSFARDSYYATHYPHENKGQKQKVMLLVKVLVGSTQLGCWSMTVPVEPLYTSKNKDGTVIVKYDDASFYPVNIIYYSGLHRPNVN